METRCSAGALSWWIRGEMDLKAVAFSTLCVLGGDKGLDECVCCLRVEREGVAQ